MISMIHRLTDREILVELGSGTASLVVQPVLGTSPYQILPKLRISQPPVTQGCLPFPCHLLSRYKWKHRSHLSDQFFYQVLGRAGRLESDYANYCLPSFLMASLIGKKSVLGFLLSFRNPKCS